MGGRAAQVMLAAIPSIIAQLGRDLRPFGSPRTRPSVAGWITTTQAEAAGGTGAAPARAVRRSTGRRSRTWSADSAISSRPASGRPNDKAEVDRHLGLYLSFDPNRQIVPG